MVIIPRRRRGLAALAAALRTFPLAENIDYKHIGGMEREEKSYTEKQNEKIRKTHPFNRNEYARGTPPSLIRWMWHPKTGEMLVDSGAGMYHAIMHGNYSDEIQEKGIQHTMAGFDEWLRGFYFPATRELAIRPYSLESLFPRSQFVIRDEEDDAKYRAAAQEFADRMQYHVKEMLEREIGKKFKKFHMNVDNQYMADNFKNQGGERW
jgi:hypothetical protein